MCGGREEEVDACSKGGGDAAQHERAVPRSDGHEAAGAGGVNRQRGTRQAEHVGDAACMRFGKFDNFQICLNPQYWPLYYLLIGIY